MRWGPLSGASSMRWCSATCSCCARTSCLPGSPAPARSPRPLTAPPSAVPSTRSSRSGMPFYERLRPNADRLAQLLGDERGRELLAELQRLRRSSGHAGTGPQWAGSGWASSARPGEQDEAGPVGAWLAEPGEGGVALRPRDDIPAPQRADWAQDGYVPPPGTARRVVLIGESAARGWPLDPVFNPAAALRRRLAAAAPGRFQVVDLAKTGAGAADLITVLRQLPVARPDIVIAFAGNNWSLPPEDTSREPCLPAVTEIRDLLAQALRCGGYGAMRRAFIDAVVLPRARQFCAELAELHRGYGAEIIVVIPEFNLRGWRPPGDVEVPVLPAGRRAGMSCMSAPSRPAPATSGARRSPWWPACVSWTGGLARSLASC